MFSNCPDLKIQTNKMFCNSTGLELDIFCDVLPDKGFSITLADAQDLCLKKFETAPGFGFGLVDILPGDEATTIKQDLVLVDLRE